jgi:hypothetical protein
MKLLIRNIYCMIIKFASRYEGYCTPLTAHGSVSPPRNGTTIPRTRKGQAVSVMPLKRQHKRSCRALPCTAMNAHYPSSNYRI